MSHSNSHFHKTLISFLKGTFPPSSSSYFFSQIVCVHKVMRVVFSSVFALVWILSVWIIALKKFLPLFFLFHLSSFFFVFSIFLHALIVSLPCHLACFVTLPCYLVSLPHFVPSSFHHVASLPCCALCYFATSLPLPCLVALLHHIASLPHYLLLSHCLLASCCLTAFLPRCLVVIVVCTS